MANPFDHLDNYKALPNEVKTKIMDRFNTLPDTDKETIMSKVNTPMGNRGYEKPLQDVSITPLTKGEFQKTGEDVAAGMMTKGMINSNIDPYIAATVGTTIAMIPHVAAAMVGPKGVKAGGEAATGMVEAAANTTVGKAIRQTGTKEAARLTEKIAEVPLKQTAKLEAATMLKKEAGKAIGEAEKGLEIGAKDFSSETMRRVTKSPDRVVRFAERATKLTEKGADWLADKANPEQLQLFRKTAQQSIKMGKVVDDLTRSKLYEINKVFGEALGKKSTQFGEALGRYKEASAVLDGLPAQFTKEKQLLKLALTKAHNTAAAQMSLLKKLGYGAGTALVGAVGSSYGRKLAK